MFELEKTIGLRLGSDYRLFGTAYALLLDIYQVLC